MVEPDGELIREAYARFGLAYYQSECLHRELCMILAWSGLPPSDMLTRPRVEERLAYAFSLTFGEVATKLRGVLPTELAVEVQKAANTRNFLAHHFWWERVHLLFSADDTRDLIAELDGYAEFFEQLDATMVHWSGPMRQSWSHSRSD